MPPPSRPPMTLKEAKKAHRKNPQTFSYTASQHARADRLDAREEKRKKELEKEKQRKISRHKREQKEEKERATKRRLLEEGKIAVEDTWGKVSASQPRLNNFFGAGPPLAALKSGLARQTIVEESETTDGDETLGADEPEHAEAGNAIDTGARTGTATGAVQRSPDTQALSLLAARPKTSPPAKSDPPIADADATPCRQKSPLQEHSGSTQVLDDTEEEDFTDGMDDETFLLLFASPTPKGTASNSLNEDANTTTLDCLGPPTTGPVVQGSRSFSSMFGEIADDDFVAVAKQVEAQLESRTATFLPRAATTTSAALVSKTHATNPPGPSAARTTPPQPGRRGADQKLVTTVETPPTVAPPRRKGRNLPWADEFAIGASTQALMVELAQKEEAKLGSVAR